MYTIEHGGVPQTGYVPRGVSDPPGTVRYSSVGVPPVRTAPRGVESVVRRRLPGAGAYGGGWGGQLMDEETSLFEDIQKVAHAGTDALDVATDIYQRFDGASPDGSEVIYYPPEVLQGGGGGALPGGTMPPPASSSSFNWTPVLIGGGVVVGGLILWKLMG